MSGVYEAKLVRTDSPGLNNQIMFVVRNDASHSDLIYQTSDTTWQAYNSWGGNSLYVGNPAGRAYKVSFNRPYNTRQATPAGEDFFFSTEYPMVRFLEANGYDVSYQSGPRHRPVRARACSTTRRSCRSATTSTGRAPSGPTSRRPATPGVNLAFFSGNIALWKTRYEPSIDGTQHRHTARSSPTRRPRPTPRSTRPRPGPARGATRASARRPTAAGPRTR